jgi:chromate reductase
VAAADALLVVTPEYNYSIPGMLKNAIDWVSRPPEQPFAGKPAAIMSTSGSILGGARAQYHLRQIFVFVDAHPLNKPEVIVPRAQDKFDAELRLTDDHTRKAIAAQLEALAKWTARLQGGG